MEEPANLAQDRVKCPLDGKESNKTEVESVQLGIALSLASNSLSLLGKPSKEKNGNILVFFQYWGGGVPPDQYISGFFPEEKTFIA